MILDPRLLQYGVQSISYDRSGPFTFYVSISYQGISNQPSEQIAHGTFHAKNAKSAELLAELLRTIADKLPPDLEIRGL